MSAKNTREETTVKSYDLKVNYQKNPMGIDLHAPFQMGRCAGNRIDIYLGNGWR